MRKTTSALALACLQVSTVSVWAAEGTSSKWTANDLLVQRLAQRTPGATLSDAPKPKYALPDPLLMSDGSAVTRETWPQRQTEFLELFREHMHGRTPVERPEGLSFRVSDKDPHDLDGKATRELVEISFDTPHSGRRSFQVQLYLPNAAKQPTPVLVLLQFQGLTDRATPLVIERGWGLAILDRTLIAADDSKTYRDGVINAFSGKGQLAPDSWRAIAAWAWGARRVMDFLETQPAVDASRVAVIGHSRMGKTALWAGATDARFAAVISNESGAGGAALSKRIIGETIQDLSDRFPHWFCENFQRYNSHEERLPFDQHLLLACIGPRLLYVGSAEEDLWSDPRGEFLACVAASPVYELLGVEGLATKKMPPLETPIMSGRIGYHIRRGKHEFTDYDWTQYLDFLDRHLPANAPVKKLP